MELLTVPRSMKDLEFNSPSIGAVASAKIPTEIYLILLGIINEERFVGAD